MKELEKITYVEDDEDIRSLVEVALRDIAGFDLHVCESGDKALTTAPDFGPDLIILDVMMPGMGGGAETLRRMREIPCLSETLVVFMTAKAQNHEVKQYLELGATDVIVKPFNPLDLAQRLQSIWKANTKGSM
jgi:two-component system OmpR family response regulator